MEGQDNVTNNITDNDTNNMVNDTVNVDTGDNTSSTAEQAYKELYEEQQKEIKALKEEINAVKLQNQKLAIQQNVGSPKITAEELINKMFQ